MNRQGFSPLAAPLLILAVLQTIMLGALFAGVPPHPPAAILLFGMAPFLAASIAIALAAMLAGPSRTGRVLTLLAALLALISYGPHKYVDPNLALIWPSVVLGQAAALWCVLGLVRAHRAARSHDPAADGLKARGG